MKKISLIFLFFTLAFSLPAQHNSPKVVKNVIVMIPDGTSIGVVSSARWYQIYNKLGGDRLNIDPYICGTVATYNSNAPIGCSAPTTSCYMTGIPQRAKQIAIYPVADPDNDIQPVDPSMAYQPLATLLEAARITQNKSTGLVFTCPFYHATPADCSAHYYDRNNSECIASQMAHNDMDVVFGSGSKSVTDDMRAYFRRKGVKLIENDLEAFRRYNGDAKVWSLLADTWFPYELDRDTSKIPSLEEMTQKAISLLSRNENGFFLMIEGSQVDATAHANDVVGCITEFLAFDKAVGAALDFARKDGETAVIILPDHGNSGFSLGNRNCKSYTTKTLTDLFGMVSSFRNTGTGIALNLLKEPVNRVRESFKEQTGIILTDKELESILQNKGKLENDYMEVANSANIISAVNKIINSHTCFGFTSGGHTGEEVFLAVYHPQGTIPVGIQRNYEINQYLCSIMGLQTSLPDLTQQLYAKHTDVFAGYSYEIRNKTTAPVLVVKIGKKKLEIPAFKSIAVLDGKTIDLGSLAIYIDKNDMFYLSKSLIDSVK